MYNTVDEDWKIGVVFSMAVAAPSTTLTLPNAILYFSILKWQQHNMWYVIVKWQQFVSVYMVLKYIAVGGTIVAVLELIRACLHTN